MNTVVAKPSKEPWNREKLVGQKRPLRLRDIWAIRQTSDWTRAPTAHT